MDPHKSFVMVFPLPSKVDLEKHGGSMISNGKRCQAQDGLDR